MKKKFNEVNYDSCEGDLIVGGFVKWEGVILGYRIIG